MNPETEIPMGMAWAMSSAWLMGSWREAVGTVPAPGQSQQFAPDKVAKVCVFPREYFCLRFGVCGDSTEADTSISVGNPS